MRRNLEEQDTYFSSCLALHLSKIYVDLIQNEAGDCDCGSCGVAGYN